MNRALIFIIGGFLAALLAYFCVQSSAQPIQDDIRDRTQKALKDDQLTMIGVTVDGRDVTLTGIVEIENEKFDAAKLAEQIDGVRTVNNQILVAPPKTEDESEIEGAVDVSENGLSTEEINHQCEVDMADILRARPVEFVGNPARISETSLDPLDDVAAIAGNCPQSRIEVKGDTKEHAQAVADYLKKIATLPQEIITGEADANAQNHPIALRVLPKQDQPKEEGEALP